MDDVPFDEFEIVPNENRDAQKCQPHYIHWLSYHLLFCTKNQLTILDKVNLDPFLRIFDATTYMKPVSREFLNLQPEKQK